MRFREVKRISQGYSARALAFRPSALPFRVGGYSNKGIEGCREEVRVPFGAAKVQKTTWRRAERRGRWSKRLSTVVRIEQGHLPGDLGGREKRSRLGGRGCVYKEGRERVESLGCACSLGCPRLNWAAGGERRRSQHRCCTLFPGMVLDYLPSASVASGRARPCANSGQRLHGFWP